MTLEPTPDEAADAALAYAIWDSENSIRMKADCINEHLERARTVRHWLRLHGHDIRPVGETVQREE
jgi:hypothetical protein